MIQTKLKNTLAVSLSVILLTVSLTACSKKNNTVQTEKIATEGHKASTVELINLLNEDENLKNMLEKSIVAAKKINPDTKTNPAQTLDGYLAYLDWAAEALPWNISKDLSAFPKLYEQIDQSLNYFYFINDRPLSELDGKGLYNNSLQYTEPYRTWLVNFTKEWGKYLSTAESWNDEYYQKVLDDERFGIQKGWYEDSSKWKSFNDFFARYLASPEQRPIAEPDNSSVIVAPADSTPQGVWNIDKNSDIVQKEGATIKSKTFNSVATLIGEDSNYKDAFANGVLTHTFLDVYDYHRYHFPVGGTIKEVRVIPQDDAVGGEVIWEEEEKKYVLHADTPGWQMIETRACVIIDTAEHGMVALLPIGMSQVSSVNFEDNIKVGETVKKGDMLGYFLFGGSDYVMIFQEQANFTMTAPEETKGEEYEHIYMGQEYGRFGTAQ